MTTTTALSRRDLLRGHLDRILAFPPPASHLDHRRMAEDGTRDHTAEIRQIDQVRILQLLHGRDEVAAVYREWLDAFLREQATTAVPLNSWDEVPLDSAPIGWDRDVHGFLCWIGGCDFSSWQVIPVGGADRMCKRCARRTENLAPADVWMPKLPPAHGHIEYPGLLAGEPHENTIDLALSGGGQRSYGTGDANPFLLPGGWMELTVATGTARGAADTPHMEITGSTAQEGHRFDFAVALDYDPAPQGHRQSPYGFRFTSGALTGPGATRTITDVFELLDTITRGEEAFVLTAASS